MSQPVSITPSEAKAILWLIITFALWAIAHSVTAARPFKVWVRRLVGRRAYAGLYRLFYNVLAVVTFLPVLYVLWAHVPATRLWSVPFPFSILFLLVQGVGLVGLLISLLQTDVFHFIGLRQTVAYLSGADEPDPPATFVRSGAYALVRHPLYLFSMLVLWFTPVMTLNSLLFDVIATIYFYLGAMHEERRLAAEFGDAYRQYQEEVPAFIPLLR